MSTDPVHLSQIQGIASLRTQCNLPGAEDVEASANRIIAISTGSIPPQRSYQWHLHRALGTIPKTASRR